MEPPSKKIKPSAARRAPYVASACCQCHGRKLKCGGERPCARCRRHGISCSYPIKASSTAARTKPLLNEEQQFNVDPQPLLADIETLQRQLNDFRSKLSGVAESNSTEMAVANPPEFLQQTHAPERITEVPRPLTEKDSIPQDCVEAYAGPTSSTFGMITADARLANLTPSMSEFTLDGTPSSSAQSDCHLRSDLPPRNIEKSRLEDEASLNHWQVDDILDCLDVFHRSYAVLHAIPQLERIRLCAPSLLRSVKRSLWSQPTSPGRCGLLEMMKIIMATALVAQTGSKTTLSEALYQSVEPIINRSFFQSTISYDFRTLLFLVALYHFANDDLILAARSVMHAARTALEEGLFRIEKLELRCPDQTEREGVIRQLWTFFVLDRQFNFAAGLPHLLKEYDVDLPAPIGAPYLSAMISYVIVGEQAWTSLVKKNLLVSGQPPAKDAFNYFRYQLQRWHEELDPAVQFDSAEIESNGQFFLASAQNETEVYVKMILYLRSNQGKILVLRPLLIYPQAARNSTPLLVEVVGVAKKSIRALHTLITKTGLYKTRRAIFQHFLSSSLSVLFLAAAHDAEARASKHGSENKVSDTATILGDAVAELQTGLDLIDMLRTTYPAQAKLWTRFDRPRQQLVQLGILTAAPKQANGVPTGGGPHEMRQIQDPLNFEDRLGGSGADDADATATATAAGDYSGISDPFGEAGTGLSTVPLPTFDTFDFADGSSIFDQDGGNGMLVLDWFEGGFTDSSVPFGMNDWM